MSIVRIGAAVLLLVITNQSLAAEEPPDVAFLEWLGQITEIEELGVDISELLNQNENQESNKEEQEK